MLPIWILFLPSFFKKLVTRFPSLELGLQRNSRLFQLFSLFGSTIGTNQIFSQLWKIDTINKISCFVFQLFAHHSLKIGQPHKNKLEDLKVERAEVLSIIPHLITIKCLCQWNIIFTVESIRSQPWKVTEPLLHLPGLILYFGKHKKNSHTYRVS